MNTELKLGQERVSRGRGIVKGTVALNIADQVTQTDSGLVIMWVHTQTVEQWKKSIHILYLSKHRNTIV